MTAPYRAVNLTRDNLAGSQREVYSVAIGATGAVGNVRPSAGSGASAGQGNLCTISRLATGVYKFVPTQGYFKPVGLNAHLASPTSTDGSTRQDCFAQATVYDSDNSCFYVFTVKGSDNALANPSSGSKLIVEFYNIVDVSPATL